MTQPSAERRYCTFYLGEQCYGIDILTVREVNRYVSMTPVRGVPPAVRGLMNLRGQIVTVLDPAVRLGQPAVEVAESTRLIILKTNEDLAALGNAHLRTGDDLVGLCVDGVGDVVSASAGRLAPPPVQAPRVERMLDSVLQLDGQVVRIIDPERVLRIERAA